MGEHVGIERVSLGQLASRLGKVAYLAWVDRHDGKSSAPQYAQERQFQTSGCLEHDQRRSKGSHAYQQFSYARRIVGDPPLLDGWPNGHLQVVTGHVDADEELSRHSFLRTRELPAFAQPCEIRARTAAQATVRALGRTRLGRPSFPTDSVG